MCYDNNSATSTFAFLNVAWEANSGAWRLNLYPKLKLACSNLFVKTNFFPRSLHRSGASIVNLQSVSRVMTRWKRKWYTILIFRVGAISFLSSAKPRRKGRAQFGSLAQNGLERVWSIAAAIDKCLERAGTVHLEVWRCLLYGRAACENTNVE